MTTLYLILMIAFILVVLAIASVSLGWIYSGRSKVARKVEVRPDEKK